MRSDEADQISWNYARLAWQDVPNATIGDNADALSFMSPAAFVYFLPRFLIAALDRYDDPRSAIVEDVIFQLTPEAGSDVLDARVALMSGQENVAVAMFLSHVRDLANAEKSYIGSRAEKALTGLWTRLRASSEAGG